MRASGAVAASQVQKAIQNKLFSSICDACRCFLFNIQRKDSAISFMETTSRYVTDYNHGRGETKSAKRRDIVCHARMGISITSRSTRYSTSMLVRYIEENVTRRIFEIWDEHSVSFCRALEKRRTTRFLFLFTISYTQPMKTSTPGSN